MLDLRARIGRFEAPVDYGAIRPWLQRVRAVAALTVGIASSIGVLLDVPGAVFSAALAFAVMIHAMTRGRIPHSPIEPLVIDAVAIALGLGGSDHAHSSLIAAAAYLIAASITFGGISTLIWALGTFGATVAVRPLLPVSNPGELPPAGEAIVWLTVALFLVAVALSLTTAAAAVYRARRRHDEALAAERRASEMRNEFVSMVTHELRTPLTNIVGFASTLNETWQELPAEDITEFLAIITSESDHLQNLVDDVLAIPRLEAGRLVLDVTDFQLRPSAFKVVNLIFPEGGERSASVSIGGNVVVTADPNRVEQVLRNLLENARKYGGDEVSVDAIPLGDEWQIVVADTGSGLSIEDQERVFDAFDQGTTGYARSETGFGLGLTVVRHLVEAMDGRIWYEPGFPVGARFCFTLPAADAAEIGPAAAEVA